MQKLIDSERTFFAQYRAAAADPFDEFSPVSPAGVFPPDVAGVYSPSAIGVTGPDADGVSASRASGVSGPDADGVSAPSASGVSMVDADDIWPEDGGVDPPQAAGIFPPGAEGTWRATVAGSAPKSGPPVPPWRASSTSSSSSVAPAAIPAAPAAHVPASFLRGRHVDDETLAELREEQDAALALGMRWQDRGPVPDDPSQTWRSQRWRQRTSTEDASGGRWGNRGGRHRIWYTTFYGLKGKGKDFAARAADESIGKGSHKGQGQP